MTTPYQYDFYATTEATSMQASIRAYSLDGWEPFEMGCTAQAVSVGGASGGTSYGTVYFWAYLRKPTVTAAPAPEREQDAETA